MDDGRTHLPTSEYNQNNKTHAAANSYVTQSGGALRAKLNFREDDHYIIHNFKPVPHSILT